MTEFIITVNMRTMRSTLLGSTSFLCNVITNML